MKIINPQNEQLLGTLEILVAEPFRFPGVSEAEIAFIDSMTSIFIWEKSTEDELSFFNLMTFEGFTNTIDPEIAFADWQQYEEKRTFINQTTYHPYTSTHLEQKLEKTNNNLDKNIVQQFKIYYQQLFQAISNLNELQAYNLSRPKKDFEQEKDNFCISIVVGQAADNCWLCLVPIVPNSATYERNKRKCLEEQTIISSVEFEDETNEIITEIQSILNKITPILICEAYRKDYYEYQHRIVGAIAETKESAISAALQNTKMVVIEKTTVEYCDDKSRKISQFMNKCLRDRTRYELNFRDIRYSYELGQTPTGDWIGTRYNSSNYYW